VGVIRKVFRQVVISTQPKKSSKGIRLRRILLPLTKTSGSINGWDFSMNHLGGNLISYSTGMSVRHEVSNKIDQRCNLTCRAQNVDQPKAMPHPESDRPAPFSRRRCLESVASGVACTSAMHVAVVIANRKACCAVL
jgi:hypothetical protein